jgi:hypothetical protein
MIHVIILIIVIFVSNLYTASMITKENISNIYLRRLMIIPPFAILATILAVLVCLYWFVKEIIIDLWN